MSTPESGPDLRVLTGTPTPEELAALVAAVLGTVGGRPARAPRRPAWRTAARLEALGAEPVASAADPRLRGR